MKKNAPACWLEDGNKESSKTVQQALFSPSRRKDHAEVGTGCYCNLFFPYIPISCTCLGTPCISCPCPLISCPKAPVLGMHNGWVFSLFGDHVLILWLVQSRDALFEWKKRLYSSVPKNIPLLHVSSLFDHRPPVFGNHKMLGRLERTLGPKWFKTDYWDGEFWPENGIINYNTILQLDLFSNDRENGGKYTMCRKSSSWGVKGARS